MVKFTILLRHPAPRLGALPRPAAPWTPITALTLAWPHMVPPSPVSINLLSKATYRFLKVSSITSQK